MALPLGLIGSGLGGIFGNIMGSGGNRAAEESYRKAVEYLESVGIPSIEGQQIIIDNPDFLYQFTPEAEQALELGPSQFEDISTDPRLAQAQMDALASLQQMGTTPLTATEQATLNAQRRDIASQEQARQGAILQNLAARGAGGSGLELAAKLGSSQAATQRGSEESDRLMAMAQQRALESIAQAGTLGGNIRGQEFGEQAQVASAADEIARFNLANQQSIQQRNVTGRNIAAEQQAGMRQQLENQRAANLTAQQQYNKQLLQQRYQNEMQKAGQLSNLASAAGGRQQQQAAATAQNWSNIGSSVGDIASQFLVKKPEEDERAGVEFGVPTITSG